MFLVDDATREYDSSHVSIINFHILKKNTCTDTTTIEIVIIVITLVLLLS